ncbi:hypothetical protein B7R54_03145 [Subtercola boreus]|uniref:GDP-mannose--glycolipid 4-beta-D-mannosyltransferase n=1 Tax=Subtercola boreus TaxID=120213 RepID=A0A3E0VF16_9MICO|nr:glycosyltransferase [Subtercola boreus]RFA08331.1 hypothetical protein B7R54_03145 [Subtercola boreus]TQL54765.1 beta-1,4-mannosyltransferase [Subtercola boreus]
MTASNRPVPSSPARRITVLHSMPAPKPGEPTRYADHMKGGAPASVTTRFFSWRTALKADYDVFHMHWPEYLLRGSSFPTRMAKRVAFAALLVRLRLKRIPVVRTAHNLEAHELGSRVERALVRWNYRWTTTVIRLNPTTAVPSGKNAVTILHGHYRDRFSDYTVPVPIRGRLLYFGLIRPYKGVTNLEEAFRSLPAGGETLRVVGKPSSSALETAVVDAASGDPRISHWLEFVPDEDLVREIGEAQLVVLPYDEMHNSGSILVALSVGRPVLVPRSSANEALAEEVGSEWVVMYDGALTTDTLRTGLDFVEQDRPLVAVPDLRNRDWKTVGDAHYLTYVDSLALARRQGSEALRAAR